MYSRFFRKVKKPSKKLNVKYYEVIKRNFESERSLMIIRSLLAVHIFPFTFQRYLSSINKHWQILSQDRLYSWTLLFFIFKLSFLSFLSKNSKTRKYQAKGWNVRLQKIRVSRDNVLLYVSLQSTTEQNIPKNYFLKFLRKVLFNLFILVLFILFKDLYL